MRWPLSQVDLGSLPLAQRLLIMGATSAPNLFGAYWKYEVSKEEAASGCTGT